MNYLSLPWMILGMLFVIGVVCLVLIISNPGSDEPKVTKGSPRNRPWREELNRSYGYRFVAPLWAQYFDEKPWPQSPYPAKRVLILRAPSNGTKAMRFSSEEMAQGVEIYWVGNDDLIQQWLRPGTVTGAIEVRHEGIVADFPDFKTDFRPLFDDVYKRSFQDKIKVHQAKTGKPLPVY